MDIFTLIIMFIKYFFGDILHYYYNKNIRKYLCGEFVLDNFMKIFQQEYLACNRRLFLVLITTNNNIL